jgi:hypothetical protein
MIINPGSTHFDAGEATNPVLVNYADYPNAATEVSGLSNNPIAVTDDDA